MRILLGAASALCALTFQAGGCAQAVSSETPEKVAAAENDQPPPPRHGEGGERHALPVTATGVVAAFHKRGRGEIDGLQLDTGTEVRFPVKASQKLTAAVSLQDRVTIQGWKNAEETEIHAATIQKEASGTVTEVDRLPPMRQPEDAARRGPGSPDEPGDGQRPPRRSEADGLAREAKRPPREANPPHGNPAQRYSLEQAVSDQAQLHTIAFDGLAFLTGSFGLDTFLPPGKVCDYFGFQYLRDIDAREGGHNTSFLTRIANNMLAILNDGQKKELFALAKEQEADIRRFAEKRLPLIQAFRRNLAGDLPAGSQGLDRQAVTKYSAELYELDGLLAYQRAKGMGAVLCSLSATQKAALAKLKFGDSGTWPDVPEQLDRRGMSHEVHVAVMTYASEMFAWYAGSLESDTYFCPERHGMYFGGFGMKTAPAMGKRNYSISTTLTGDSGENFLKTLNAAQQKQITDLVELQRPDLAEIVQTRRAIATELRRFLQGQSADKERVLALSRHYGERDGALSYLYARAFAEVGKTLTAQQKEKLARLRTSNPSDPQGPFLYSAPIQMPQIENTDFLFGVR